MLKSSWQARGLAKRIIIILIVSVLLLSAAACNRKGPPQSGILEDDYDLTIEGEVGGSQGFCRCFYAEIPRGKSNR